MKIRNLGIEKRVELYNKAIELRKKYGWGKTKIGRSINVNNQTVGQWLYRGTNPKRRNRGYFNVANLTPSEHLSYICGAILGDGYLSKNSFRLGIRVTDKDFIKEFENNLSTIINSKNYSIYRTIENNSLIYRINVTCHNLYRFIKDIEKVKSLAKVFPSKFIRGFVDAEGSVELSWSRKEKKWKRDLQIYNTNKDLLEFIKELARKYFDIKFKLFERIRREGQNKNIYYLRIRDKNNFYRFYKYIGFSIKRKQQILENIINKSYKEV
jgi:intein-encoded DNA endonuclease-like protein